MSHEIQTCDHKQHIWLFCYVASRTLKCSLWIQHPRMPESANSIELVETSLPMCTCATQNHCTPSIPLYPKYLNILFAPSSDNNKKWQGVFTIPRKLEDKREFNLYKETGKQVCFFFFRYLKDFLKWCFYAEIMLYYIFSHMVHWKIAAGFCLD